MRSQQFQLHADIEQRHWWFVARRRIMLELVGQVLRPSPTTTVMDIGCGTGGNLAELANHYRAVGVDTSGEAIRFAQSRFPRAQFMCGVAPRDFLPIVSEARLMMMMDVLEHVPDDFALLSELLAASKPGTLLLLTVPAGPELWSQHDESFGHYRRYDLPRFQQLWAGLPVHPLLVSYYNSRLLPAIKLVRAMNRRRGQAAGAAGTDFKMPAAPLNRLLTRIFAGEARRLSDALERKCPGYGSGVSLIALLRREAGPIGARPKPAGVTADLFDPAACGV